jgi:hypothetical protein
VLDTGNAGTATRFLLAFLCLIEDSQVRVVIISIYFYFVYNNYAIYIANYFKQTTYANNNLLINEEK